MTTGPLSILIVGGGIAGCSAAIALASQGHRVRLVEKQAAWRFLSSGIFVYSNGLASLDRLGLLAGVQSAGFVVPNGRNLYFDHTGAQIAQTFYPTAHDGRVPAILGVKRAELHRVMTARVADLGAQVTLGATVEHLCDRGGHVEVALSTGESLKVDLVVGADGVRSQIRAEIGIDVAPRYTGFGVWRSVHARPAELVDKIMMMGRGARFGIMPISEDRLYTFGTMVEPKERHYDPAAFPATMRAKFSEFKGPAAPFLDELDGDAQVHYTAIEEVALPLPWHRGRVLLIGDAAHASTPFMGQGGAMAIQDGVALAQVLSRYDDIAAALDAFGAARAPVCQFVQSASRAVGEAGAREHSGDLDARNANLRASAQGQVDAFYAKLAALNAEADAHLVGADSADR